MKLFVWNDPYGVSYGMSQYIAVAETVEQARELAKTAQNNTFGTPDGTTGIRISGENLTPFTMFHAADWICGANKSVAITG